MKQGSAPLLLWLVAGCALGGPRLAAGHEFSMEAVMNGFVVVEPGQARLLVRVPLFALHPARLPLSGRELDLAHAGAASERALALVADGIVLFEEGRVLSPARRRGRFTPPTDRSFDAWPRAAVLIGTPLPAGATIYADQGYFDAELTYPIATPAARFSLRTELAPELGDYLKLAVRFHAPGETERALLLTRGSGTVALNPSWLGAAKGFLGLGVEHILTGADHLFFLLCLILPVVRLRQVVPIVTAFTVGHSFTLLGSAFGLAPSGAWFAPLVEAAIAGSIVYAAIEDMLVEAPRDRWLVSGACGLVHGFGFAAGLQQNLMFAGQHLAAALLAFNLGIELGQLAVLALTLTALSLLGRLVPRRTVTLVVAALLAHQGWHWMVERGQVLLRAPRPRMDGPALVVLARWALGLLLTVAAVRALSRRLGPGRVDARWRQRGAVPARRGAHPAPPAGSTEGA